MTDKHKKLVGDRIKAALECQNRTQRELAEHLGVQTPVVSYFCTGDRTPNTEQLAMISDYLGVSADYLLGTHGDETADNKARFLAEKTCFTHQTAEALFSAESEADFIAQRTGLTEDVVQTLISAKKDR